MLEKHLTQLAQDIQLPELAPQDPNGYFSLTFKEDLTVFLKDLSPGIAFCANLIPLPAQGREDLFIYLMKANFVEQGTGQQTLGIDSEEKFLTLSRTIAYEVNYTNFKEMLENFVNYLAYWKNELQKKKT